MATTSTPVVVLVTRDGAVTPVAATLDAEGILVRTVGSSRDLAREVAAARSACVAVLDADMAQVEGFSMADAGEVLRATPLLVLRGPDREGRASSDPGRSAIEEAARKPIVPSVLALRVKALILAAGYALPAQTPQVASPRGPLEFSEDARGQMTVVFSVKGGSGKSTIAANLAAGLASVYGARTLLVDADLWFGDLGVLLNMTSGRSSLDVCGAEDPDLFALPKAVVQHASGAAVLLRPPDPLSVEKLKPRSFVEAVERYRSLYEHVIVDTTVALSELNLDLMEAASRVLLIVTPEMGALHNTARFLALADRLNLADKLSLILNRANSGINAEDLQRTLGLPVARGVVSAGRLMLDAVNQGTTLFAMDPTRRERITQDLAAVVELVAGREQPVVQREQRGRGLPRLLRRSA